MRDVATAVGLSISALFFLEHGTDPQLTTARRLAEFFGTTTDDLWRPLEIKR
jgi:DNA-binding XRE family transcriptional regulator